MASAPLLREESVMQALRWKIGWTFVPLLALSVVPFRLQAQGCEGVMGATATVPDMAEEGGVGNRVQTLAERALERIAKRDPERRWPADTTVRIGRVQVIMQTPPPADPAAARLRITVILPD
jgi:hypothetical protein